MKKLFLICGIFGIALILDSCNLNDDGVNFHYKALEITGANLPESFDLGQIYDIDVTLVRPDDCTLIEGFEVVRGDSTVRRVAAIGAILDKDDCRVLDQEITDSFRFEVLYTKTYLFRFYTGDDANGDPQFLEIEVPVNDASIN